MSFFRRLFGARDDGNETEPVSHLGFAILPTPIREGNTYRISAKIEKEVDGNLKTHTLIRADTVADLDGASTASIHKAKQLIDQMGDALFD